MTDERFDEQKAEEASASALEHEIESIRSELGDLVDELDRRRHEIVDVRLQARRHPRAIALAVTAAGLIVAGHMALRRRRSQRLGTRAVNLARVLATLSNEDPSKVRRAVRGRPTTVSALGALAKLAAGAVAPQRGATRSAGWLAR
jgi:hypothetical protein